MKTQAHTERIKHMSKIAHLRFKDFQEKLLDLEITSENLIANKSPAQVKSQAESKQSVSPLLISSGVAGCKQADAEHEGVY